MKIVFIFIIGIIIISWYIFPIIADMRICYEKIADQLDDISIQTRTKSWDTRTICEAKFTAINELNVCLGNTWENYPQEIKIFASTIHTIRKLTQPFIFDLNRLQSELNMECQAYPDLLFTELIAPE